MEADRLLQIMEFFWFQHRIFDNKQESPSLSPKFLLKNEGKASAVNSGGRNLQIRSYSERCITVDLESDSPESVIIKPKLQKIPEVCYAGSEKREKRRGKKRYGGGERGMSRSLSALEFEELKGFMDLGFVFDEEETNNGLASIIPGLQKRGKTAVAAEGGSGGGVEIPRPYLSEAWGDLNWRRRDGNILVNWKSVKNEMDMKDHLKIWAHAVASTVR